jgi:arsenical pump membrane protein
MVLPWVLVCIAEWLGLRVAFRRDLPAAHSADASGAVPAPRYALGVLGLTVAGFVITSSVHVAPAWAAVGGCVLLLAPRLRTGEVNARRLVAEASPGFCLFVLALAIIVEAVTRHGLGAALRSIVPSTTSLGALLLAALVAAGLANLVNNLPATLALVPLTADRPALVLAVLLGVNVGPNLSYGGSLATLLWRRLLPDRDKPRAAEFHLLGVLTVPLLLVLTTSALWAALHVNG